MATATAPANMTTDQIGELKALLTQDLVERYPDIVQMLFQTPSLVFEEKKYWLQLLPLMADEHVERLRKILLTEHQKLEEINAKYDAGMKTVGSMAPRVSREEIAQRRAAIKAQEQAADHLEGEHEAELMQQLNGI